jgi:hypothetical protein
MGSFFTNVHIKCNEIFDQPSLVKDLGLTAAYFSDCENGWISLFPEKTEEQDAGFLKRVCAKLSKRYACPTFAFLVHDSDVFLYFLADKGKVVDSYNSCPAYFDEDASGEPSGGKVDLVFKLCLSGTEKDILNRLLKENKFTPPPKSEEDRAKIESDVVREKKELVAKYAQMGEVPPERVKEVVPDIDEMLSYLERDIRFAHRDTEDLSADDVALQLANLLGIPSWRPNIGYNYISNDEIENLGALVEVVDQKTNVEVTPNAMGWIKCPNCGYSFSSKDKKAFEGQKHKSCGQRLKIVAAE